MIPLCCFPPLTYYKHFVPSIDHLDQPSTPNHLFLWSTDTDTDTRHDMDTWTPHLLKKLMGCWFTYQCRCRVGHRHGHVWDTRTWQGDGVSVLHRSLLCGCIILPSTSLRKLTAMAISLSKSGLLHMNSHSHLVSLWAPICRMTWFCWQEMRYNLGYFANSVSSPVTQLSSQNLILSPHPTLHNVPFWRVRPCCEWWKAILKSLHHMDSLVSRDVASKLLQPPYFDSNILAHNSPWCWNRLHFHLQCKIESLNVLEAQSPFFFWEAHCLPLNSGNLVLLRSATP